MTLTILQIIPNLGAGGAEQAVVDMTAGLVARGDRALVVSSGGSRVEEVIRAGGKHYVFYAASKNPWQIIANAKLLARLIRDERVDIVHARSRAPAWSAWLACRMTGCRFVTTFHAAYKFSSAVKKFYNRVMTRSDRIIAISQFIADHIAANYGGTRDKIRVIYRGIDSEKFTPDNIGEERRVALREAWGVKPDEKIILLPARLSAIKGQSLLIEAMALPPLRDKAVTAVIIGDDQGRVRYRLQLEDLIAAKGQDRRVRLVPHCRDMPAAYSLASVVAMPSLVPEGFGRVPVEAMAMGVPVVASNLGATRETIIEGVTGWLLPPKDAALWAQTIAKALDLPEGKRHQMAIAARHDVQTRFTRDKMVADTLAVYDEVIRN
jgi:glycosyltransferase involved in cell wall biosynthesis